VPQPAICLYVTRQTHTHQEQHPEALTPHARTRVDRSLTSPTHDAAFGGTGTIEVPICDRREISFDAASLLSIVAASARVAQAAGLPAGVPKDVTFNAQQHEIAFVYADEEQPIVIGSSALAALLISYCMSAGIKIPRKLDREIRVDGNTVVFICTTAYTIPTVRVTIQPGILRMQSAVPGSAAEPE